MHRISWMRRAGWLAGLAVVLASLGLARADEPPKPGRLDFELFSLGDPEPIKPSDYWLGLGCAPVQAALRAQLKLPEDEGLVVEQVVPDSPAAKAGIQQYDVLLKAGGKPLGKLQDLIDAVDASKNKDLTLELIRGGESLEIQVKPAKRPKSAQPKILREEFPGALKQYFDLRRPGEGVKPPWRLRFWGPGWILPPDAKAHPPLPANLTVTITKAGDEPAKIVVKRGDQKWEVTEDQLHKLPGDIRPHVERMLGRVPLGPGPKWSYDFDFVPELPTPHWEGRPEGRLEKRLEEMNRRIDELRKSIEQMRRQRPRLKGAPKLKEAPAPKKDPQKKPDRV